MPIVILRSFSLRHPSRTPQSGSLRRDDSSSLGPTFGCTLTAALQHQPYIS